MLETPLHHCYLIPADNPVACVDVVKAEIAAAVGDEAEIQVENFDRFTIELARELRSRGELRATGETRCLVYTFNLITTEAQNALLKIIENPAAGIHFFFVMPTVGDLLETVRSRSWILRGVCGADNDEHTAALTEEFLAASGLADRLSIAGKLESADELRRFVQALSRQKDRPGALGEALELVADYSRDTGASVKLLGQLLAVAAGHSPNKK